MIDRLLKIYYKLPFRPFRKQLSKVYTLKIKREINKKVCVERHGFKINLDLGDIIQNHMYHGIYKATIVDLIKNKLKEGDIAFDIGANIGYFSMIFATLVKNKGRIYAFEPTNSGMNKIKENIKLNNFKNIILEQSGLSDKEEELEIGFQEEYRLDRKNKEEVDKYKLIPLDKFVKDNKINRVNLIKIDTNGFDLKILKGSIKTINKFKPIVIIKTSYDKMYGDKNKFYKQFADLFFSFKGYQVYFDIDGIRKPIVKDELLKISKERGACNVILKPNV